MNLDGLGSLSKRDVDRGVDREEFTLDPWANVPCVEVLSVRSQVPSLNSMTACCRETAGDDSATELAGSLSDGDPGPRRKRELHAFCPYHRLPRWCPPVPGPGGGSEPRKDCDSGGVNVDGVAFGLVIGSSSGAEG